MVRWKNLKVVQEEKIYNLIVCLTPLQALIACKIIDIFPNEKFFVLFINLKSNETYEYYNQKLSAKSLKTWVIKRKQYPKIGDLLTFIKFKMTLERSILSYQYNKVLFASIDDPIIQYIIKHGEYKEINTFDDGFANLSIESAYFKESRTIKYNLKKLFFNNSFNLILLKNRITRHYTIFENNPFLSPDKTFKLNMFLISSSVSESNVIIKRIFVGQPMKSISPHLTEDYLNDVLKTLKIDYYFPHPQEQDNYDFENVQIINSDLIFEDYVLDFLKKEPTLKILVYGLFSTILITMSQAGIECYYITDTLLNKKYANIHKVLNDNNVCRIEINKNIVEE